MERAGTSGAASASASEKKAGGAGLLGLMVHDCTALSGSRRNYVPAAEMPLHWNLLGYCKLHLMGRDIKLMIPFLGCFCSDYLM